MKTLTIAEDINKEAQASLKKLVNLYHKVSLAFHC